MKGDNVKMQLIALFFPSILGTKIYTKMEPTFESIVKNIYVYIIFTIATNVFSMFTVEYVLGVGGVVIEALNSFSFFMVYTVLSVAISVFGAIVANAIHVNFTKRG